MRQLSNFIAFYHRPPIISHSSFINIKIKKRFSSRISLFPIIIIVFLIPLNEPLKRDIRKLTSIIKFHLLSSPINHLLFNNINQKRFSSRLFPIIIIVLNFFKRTIKTIKTRYYKININYQISSLTNHLSLNNINQKTFPPHSPPS